MNDILHIKDLISWLILIIGFVVTISLAIWRYRVERRDRKRQEKLLHIDQQIQKLYGPLHSLVQARQTHWERFSAHYDMTTWIRGVNGKGQSIPEADRDDWINWVRADIDQKRKMTELMLNNFHLTIGYKNPGCFMTFIAHTHEYELILQRWSQGDYTSYFSIIPYPYIDLKFYLEESFDRLKITQYNLLGHSYELDSTPFKLMESNDTPAQYSANDSVQYQFGSE